MIAVIQSQWRKQTETTRDPRPSQRLWASWQMEMGRKVPSRSLGMWKEGSLFWWWVVAFVYVVLERWSWFDPQSVCFSRAAAVMIPVCSWEFPTHNRTISSMVAGPFSTPPTISWTSVAPRPYTSSAHTGCLAANRRARLASAQAYIKYVFFFFFWRRIPGDDISIGD